MASLSGWTRSGLDDRQTRSLSRAAVFALLVGVGHEGRGASRDGAAVVVHLDVIDVVTPFARDLDAICFFSV